MQEFICTDETFDIYSTAYYRLSIQLGLDGFSFCILDTAQNKYVQLYHQPYYLKWPGQIGDELSRTFSETKELQAAYKSTSVSIVSPKAALVPTSLFSEDDSENYYYQNFPFHQNEIVAFNRLKKSDNILVYSVPKLITEFIADNFQEAGQVHHSSVFIESSLKNITQNRRCFVHIHNNFIEVLVANQEKIHLFNYFNFQNETDILYYILYIYKQLGLSADFTEIITSGFIKKEGQLYQDMKRYIKRISFTAPDADSSYSYTINRIPGHHFSTLFNLHQCGL